MPRKALLRLGKFLDRFAPCFLRKPGHDGASRYISGLLGPSQKKNLYQMWEALNDPGDYQAFQHFMASSPWEGEPVWREIRRVCPGRRGVAIIDGVGVPKQGTHSVGVKRQYCGALGKIANCQVAVSTILRANFHTWPMAMDLYLPKEWTEDKARREKAEIPDEIGYRKRWEIGLDQLENIIDDGIEIECVVADAEFGDCIEFRTKLAGNNLFYVVGISKNTTIFTEVPRIIEGGLPRGGGRGRPRVRRIARDNPKPKTVEAVARQLPRSAWREIRWRNGVGLQQHSRRYAALRVYPAHGWQNAEIHDECWLLIEERPDEMRYHVSNLPAKSTLRKIASYAHGRWPIEQSYSYFKTELGFDDFAGRNWNGWNHHAVLTAVAFTFIELERKCRAKSSDCIPFPAMRKFICRIFLSMFVAGDRELFELTLDFERDPPWKT